MPSRPKAAIKRVPRSPSPSVPATPYDLRLLFPVLFLVGIGMVMVYSASSALALKKFGSSYFFLKKQALFALVGLMALVAARHFPYRLWQKLAYPAVVLVFLMLLAVLIGWGHTAGGATRWLRVAGFTFQPSELARIALTIYLAYSLSKKSDRLREFAIGFMPHIIVLAMLLVPMTLQPDFGSVVILTLLTGIMMFAGGVPMRHLFLASMVLLPVGIYLLVSAEYRIRRLMSFLDPWEYATAEGYQTIHSLMAFGSGGLWGAGIGKSLQKLFYLPEPHTDFIFSVIGEEFGLMGVTLTVALYSLIIWRGIAIARQTQDLFGALLSFGLTTALALQVCINMGVALGLLPTKGLTLPFLSYGGTSLVLNMAAIGILMNIGTVTWNRRR
ncbi:MAG: putative lipid II flippase FtsW [Desulfobacterales bacterium]|nr:putative lipid II flippase FtsW [Desulfobacterales bacterium]MDJ0873744.1 putative lipid II flippase FtsW [Desulfobacterales bacterium]MDJ0883234.1 putative lipid II flippase FtsW [Desulfobacterales bacterium]